MQIIERRNASYVGNYVHKDTYTAVGVSQFGKKLFEITVGNYESEFESLAKKIEQMKGMPSLSLHYGFEDCHGYRERLADYLLGTGQPTGFDGKLT